MLKKKPDKMGPKYVEVYQRIETSARIKFSTGG